MILIGRKGVKGVSEEDKAGLEDTGMFIPRWKSIFGYYRWLATRTAST